MNDTAVNDAWLDEVFEDEFDRVYLAELCRLQIELLKLQTFLVESGQRLAVLFEGRDAAGKGGAIMRFSQNLMPRHARTVALPKPSQQEAGQWYFQRYIRHLPDPGEVVFFDRSWYNRAVIEPVMGFCSDSQYALFMDQVVPFEHMLLADGLHLVKLWFSIDRDEQRLRLDRRRNNPLRRWKLSTVDMQAQLRWEASTRYKDAMFATTSTDESPWIIVAGNNKQRARLESMRHVLGVVPYPDRGQPGLRLDPDPAVIGRAGPPGRR